MKNKRKKIWLISSSTGGHALPILLLYKNLNAKPNFDVEIFHTGSEMERKLFKDCHQRRIISKKFDRNSLLKRLLSVPVNLIGMIQVKILLLFKRPSLIFSKGGFGSVPILYMARIFRVPYFIHESDSHMGLSNRLFSGSADRVFLGFPKELYDQDFQDQKYQYVGQIIEKGYSKSKDCSKKTIYITGGSLGAKNINKIIFKIMPKLLNKYTIYHTVGEENLKSAQEAREGLLENKDNYHFSGFSFDFARRAFAEADLLIARAGANTIGEIAAYKKASILIPYPYAASDHQYKNARYLEQKGGAIIIKEEKLDENSLLDRIDYLFSNRKNLEVLGENASKAILSDGAKIIVEEISEFFERKK